MNTNKNNNLNSHYKTTSKSYKSSIIIASVLLGIHSTSFAEEEKVLNIYNWSDYIAEDTIEKFEQETGIEVTYDVFDSNEVLQTKLLTGGIGYDIVVPTGDFLERQISAGVFAKLDKSQLTNLENLDSAIMQAAANHDPNNEHAINYLWGTTGIGYNEQRVKEILPDAPVDSLALVFDINNISKLSECGVSLLDAPTEIFRAAMAYLGIDTKSTNKEDFDKAEELLLSIRPYVKYFHSSQYINDLANGEVCVSVGWSGDILQARDRAVEVGQDFEIKYSIPKEGALMWFDMLAIPNDAPHPENAHKFLNFVMQPEIISEVTNYVNYANGNSASIEFVDDEVKNNPSIYPTEEVKDKLYTAVVYDQRLTRTINRSWTKIKTGN